MKWRSLDDEAQSFNTGDVCAGVCGFVQKSLPQNICGFSTINAHFGKDKATNTAMAMVNFSVAPADMVRISEAKACGDTAASDPRIFNKMRHICQWYVNDGYQHYDYASYCQKMG